MVDNSPAPSNPIDLLVRSDDALENNRQKNDHHRKIVRSMRLLLPLVVLVMVVILMTWKSDNVPVEAVPREKISPQTISQNELINPKFQSEDSDNNPYTITADKATQNAGNMDVIMLEKPVADITLKSGGAVSVKAANGTYNQGDKTMSLDGMVKVTNDDGYELQTEKMHIDVTGQVITSDQPVTGHGASADIQSSGMRVDGANKTVIFTGPTKLILRKKENE